MDSEGYVKLANDMLGQLHLAVRIKSLSDIHAGFFVMLYEGLLCEKLPDITRSPKSKEDEIHNCQCVIDSLSLDVLHTTLSHIQGQDIVNGDHAAISNLLEVFSGFMEYLLCRIESEVSDTEEEAAVEERDPDKLHYDVIEQALSQEFEEFKSKRGPVTSTQKDETETTADLIALGDYQLDTGQLDRHETHPHPAAKDPHPFSQPVAASSFKQESSQLESTAELIRESQDLEKRMLESRGVLKKSNDSERNQSIENPRMGLSDQNVHSALPFSTSTRMGSSVFQAQHSQSMMSRSLGVPLNTLARHEAQPSSMPHAVALPPRASARYSHSSQIYPHGSGFPSTQRTGPAVFQADRAEQQNAVTVGERGNVLDKQTVHKRQDVDADITSSSMVSPPGLLEASTTKSTAGQFETLGLRPRKESPVSDGHVTSSTDTLGTKHSKTDDPLRFEHHHYHHYSDVDRQGQGAGLSQSTGALTRGQVGDVNIHERWPTLSAIASKSLETDYGLEKSFKQLQSRSERLRDMSASLREKVVLEDTKPVQEGRLISHQQDRDAVSKRITHSKENHEPDLRPSHSNVLRGKTYTQLEDEYKDSESSEDNLSQHSDSMIDYEEPVRDTDLVRENQKQHPLKKQVRFHANVDRKTRSALRAVRQDLQTEDRTNRMKTQMMGKRFQHGFDRYKDKTLYKQEEFRKSASSKESKFKKRAFPAPKVQPWKPRRKIQTSVLTEGRPRLSSRLATRQTRKRSASCSPTLVRSRSPLVLGDGDLLPLMLDEFPLVHLSSETVHNMWKKQFRQIENISKSAQEVKRKKSKAQIQIEEADRRQKIVMDIMKKEMSHDKRMQDVKERRDAQIASRSKIHDKRIQTVKARRYYDDYQVRLRSKMLKKKTREEQVFKKLFKEGLEIQKERIRDLRTYAREQRSKIAEKQQNELQSLENFYRDQFSCLAESMVKERKDVAVREKAQENVLNQMKKALKKKMETEIRSIQTQLVRDEDDAYFRELDAERLRHDLRSAHYHTKY